MSKKKKIWKRVRVFRDSSISDLELSDGTLETNEFLLDFEDFFEFRFKFLFDFLDFEVEPGRWSKPSAILTISGRHDKFFIVIYSVSIWRKHAGLYS